MSDAGPGRETWRKFAGLLSLSLAFGCGWWMRPGLQKFHEEMFVGRKEISCLPQSEFCVGRRLSDPRMGVTDLVFEEVVCSDERTEMSIPLALVQKCDGGIAKLAFSRGGRWFIVDVQNGLVSRIEDGPKMGWAL